MDWKKTPLLKLFKNITGMCTFIYILMGELREQCQIKHGLIRELISKSI